jgi:alanyl-tRNA synthetase
MIILKEEKLTKGWVVKSEAEKKHGFRLYQGGVIPGNMLRVV